MVVVGVIQNNDDDFTSFIHH